MNHPYIKQVFIAYILVMSIIAIFTNKQEIVAEELVTEDVEVIKVEKVYQLEMNRADFIEVKKDILMKDVKYIAYPESFKNDLSLSEVVVKNIDYTSEEVQEVLVNVIRYTDSKSDKQVLDVITGKALVHFKDTLAPTLELTKSKVEITEGDSFDDSKYVKTLEDNSFSKPTLHIDNPVNSKEPGTYSVNYTASDASGNTTSKALEVVVNKKPEVKVASATRSNFTPAPASGSNISVTLNLINQHRANAGLHPLQLGGSVEMNATALRAAEAMSYVSHTRPDGRSYMTAFTDAGIYRPLVIEVLVYAGYSPADKVNWWMNSPVHRRVLLRSDITHISIGIYGPMYAAIVYN